MYARIKRILWFLTDSNWRSSYLISRRRRIKYARARRLVMRKLSSKGSLKVLNGPFEGMKYIPSFNGEYFTQKVLGYYEYVLSGTIGKVCDTGYGTIIDVGAAEGYYACGLAVRLPSARVVCFEADGAKHEAIRR